MIGPLSFMMTLKSVLVSKTQNNNVNKMIFYCFRSGAVTGRSSATGTGTTGTGTGYSTGKSFSEALILASTNPQYDKRLFMELP